MRFSVAPRPIDRWAPDPAGMRWSALNTTNLWPACTTYSLPLFCYRGYSHAGPIRTTRLVALRLSICGTKRSLQTAPWLLAVVRTGSGWAGSRQAPQRSVWLRWRAPAAHTSQIPARSWPARASILAPNQRPPTASASDNAVGGTPWPPPTVARCWLLTADCSTALEKILSFSVHAFPPPGTARCTMAPLALRACQNGPSSTVPDNLEPHSLFQRRTFGS